MAKKTYSLDLFLKCSTKYQRIKAFLLAFDNPLCILNASFKCPKNDSIELVLLLTLDHPNNETLKVAFLIVIAALLKSLCLYH